MRTTLRVPRDFSLDAIVASHGWYQLKPFRFDPESRALGTCIRLPGGGALDVRIAASAPGALSISADGTLATRDRAFVLERLARMLHLDAAIGPFHVLCRRDPGLRWIAQRKLGRILRAQDLFEDALKTLLTTNCTWKQTVSMVGRLVDLIGPESASGTRAFPSPDAVRRAGRKFFEKDVRVGYRAGAVMELAERARDPEFESFSAVDEDAARRTIKSWNGFGDYAATALLALLGKRGRPVVDSWALARASELHFAGKACRPGDIERVYARFGDWAGLVAWFDLNREHYREWPPTFGIKPDTGAERLPAARPSRARPPERRPARRASRSSPRR